MKNLLISASTLAALAPSLAHAHPGHEHSSGLLFPSLTIALITLACVCMVATTPAIRSRALAVGKRLLRR